MRAVKFRGRRVGDGEWVYGNLIDGDRIVGNLVEWHDEYFCTEFWYVVDPETVGQLTGLKDKNGTEIYDGDHLYAPGNLTDELQYVGTVEWDEEDARWEVGGIHGRFEWIPNDQVVVRGNKFQTAEVTA